MNQSIAKLHSSSASPSTFQQQLSLANMVRIQLINHIERDLVLPVIGNDFVFGILEDNFSKGLIRNQALVGLRFFSSGESATISWSKGTFAQQLASQDFPFDAQMSYLAKPGEAQAVRVLGSARGFLITDSQLAPAIPLSAIGFLEIPIKQTSVVVHLASRR